jgi:hypothetical protein
MNESLISSCSSCCCCSGKLGLLVPVMLPVLLALPACTLLLLESSNASAKAVHAAGLATLLYLATCCCSCLDCCEGTLHAVRLDGNPLAPAVPAATQLKLAASAAALSIASSAADSIASRSPLLPNL